MITLDSGLTITNSTFSIVLSHQEPARVILAVPHDGLIKNDFSDLFQERKHGWHGRDVHVWPIANDVVQKCLRLGTRVDAVRFLMARAYIDANRELPSDNNLDSDILGQTALEDRRLISVYRHYHRELCQLVERSITAFGAQRVLFVDLHGFGKQPGIAQPEGYDLILGTANRSSIHHGEVDRAFAKFIEERGYRVFLPGEKPIIPQGDPYSAGHTTRWYAGRYSINAIQIEVSSMFRKRENKEQGERLATDIAEFFSRNYV